MTHIYTGILPSHRKEYNGSFVETWMDLGSVIQSELTQKQRNKYRILMHICRIQKDGTDEPVFRVGKKTQTLRMDRWAWWGRGGGTKWETGSSLFLKTAFVTRVNSDLLFMQKSLAVDHSFLNFVHKVGCCLFDDSLITLKVTVTALSDVDLQPSFDQLGSMTLSPKSKRCVLIRVFQRNRTNRIYLHMSLCMPVLYMDVYRQKIYIILIFINIIYMYIYTQTHTYISQSIKDICFKEQVHCCCLVTKSCLTL